MDASLRGMATAMDEVAKFMLYAGIMLLIGGMLLIMFDF